MLSRFYSLQSENIHKRQFNLIPNIFPAKNQNILHIAQYENKVNIVNRILKLEDRNTLKYDALCSHYMQMYIKADVKESIMLWLEAAFQVCCVSLNKKIISFCHSMYKLFDMRAIKHIIHINLLDTFLLSSMYAQFIWRLRMSQGVSQRAIY